MARKVTYDQEKVKELRMEVILASLAIMKDEDDASNWSQYKKDLVMKYAPRVLPVLQEHSGTDGKPINITFDNALARKTEGGSKK